jgi:transposase
MAATWVPRVIGEVASGPPVHKVAGVAEAIEGAGATLIYLPKYSPDLNPIELAFSKLKAHLRKAAEHTIPRLFASDWSRRYPISARAKTSFATRAIVQRDRNPL